MVIILQLCLFGIALAIRGSFLIGRHLQSGSGPHYLSYVARTKRGISARHVGIIQHHGIPFIVKPERWYHRFLKSIGIASEIRISQQEFDHRYFITTDYPSDLERTLASGQLLVHLKALFALPVKSLHAMPHRIWCIIKKEDLEEPDAYFEQHVELLKAISKCTAQSADYRPGSSSLRVLGLVALAFISVHAGLFALGILGIFPTLTDSIDIIDSPAWISKGVIAGGAVALVWFFLILHIFQKTSWVCWVIADFFLCGLVGFMLSGVFAIREANTHLPQPLPHVFAQPILQKICVLECKQSCGRRCTRRSSYQFQGDASCNPDSRAAIFQQKTETDPICRSNAWFEYKIKIHHWRDPADYSFTPESRLFDSVQVGSFLTVPVHQGAIGLEWIDIDNIHPR